MHKRLQLSLLLLSFLSFQVQLATASEDRVDISGKVVESSGAPLQAATVVLLSLPDSSLVTGTATDANGEYSFNGINAGDYFLRASFVGYVTQETEAFALESGSDYRVPNIALEVDAVMMETVNIQGERELIEVQPDKTVLNVQGTINATGSNGLELLKKSPGVLVDNNDNIILSGKNGVRIYIDGKPSPLSTEDLALQLRSMQASEIDAIEIITNPGAKYDAEGNAGIINIRLRRDQSLGFNSTLDLGYGYGENSRYNTNTTFNYRTPKFNTFGSYAFSGGQSENWINLYRIQNDILYDLQSNSEQSGPGHRARIGNDFFVGDNLIIGLLASGYVNDRNWLNSSLTPITNLATDELQSILEASSDNDGVRRNITLNGNLRWDNKQGITTGVDADFAQFYNSTLSFQPNTYRDPGDPGSTEENNFSSDAPTRIDIYAGRIDHERNALGGKFGLGAKLSSVTTDNSYRFYELDGSDEILDIDRSNDFVFRETIGAGYVNYFGKVGKAEYNVGLRAEYTDSKGELTAFKPSNNNVVNRDYIDFFPSAGISVQANQKNQVRLNYSRRVDRPSYAALNPFEFKLDELSFARGNPFLQPQYTHSVSLSHTYNYVLNTTLSYSYTDDFFARISDSTDVSRTVLETINMNFQQVLSANVSYPRDVTNWWSTYTSLTAYNTRNRADLSSDRTVDIQVTVGNVYHQSSFKLPRDWTFEVSGWLNSPSLWGAVYEVDTNYSIDTGVRKRFLDGRADFKIAFTDVFDTASWRGVQDFSGFFVDASGGWESRQLRLNFSYLFGNSKVKKARQRQTSTQEESERVN